MPAKRSHADHLGFSQPACEVGARKPRLREVKQLAPQPTASEFFNSGLPSLKSGLLSPTLHTYLCIEIFLKLVNQKIKQWLSALTFDFKCFCPVTFV